MSEATKGRKVRTISLNPVENKKVIDKLDSVSNRSTYVIELVEKDLKKEKKKDDEIKHLINEVEKLKEMISNDIPDLVGKSINEALKNIEVIENKESNIEEKEEEFDKDALDALSQFD